MTGIDLVIHFLVFNNTNIPVFENLNGKILYEHLIAIVDFEFAFLLTFDIFDFIKEVHVFALECRVGDGQRIYLVTTYAQLWFYYKSR